MIWNTRFNPTANGPLHLGHIYLLLINAHEAKKSGGKFGIRFDNTQRSWLYNQGRQRTEDYIKDMSDDIDWLGIKPDFIDKQSDMIRNVNKLLNDEFNYEPDPEAWSCGMGAEVVGASHHYYPYTDRLTSEKVIMDCMEGVNWLIRGMDLITEDCLYRHFCNKFQIFIPRMSYIPRLYCGISSVSKTEGKYQLKQFREKGMSMTNLIIMLARDCLIDPEIGWLVDNIKDNPTIGKWADEVLNGIS